jgi:hypothetical protein
MLCDPNAEAVAVSLTRCIESAQILLIRGRVSRVILRPIHFLALVALERLQF